MLQRTIKPKNHKSVIYFFKSKACSCKALPGTMPDLCSTRITLEEQAENPKVEHDKKHHKSEVIRPVEQKKCWNACREKVINLWGVHSSPVLNYLPIYRMSYPQCQGYSHCCRLRSKVKWFNSSCRLCLQNMYVCVCSWFRERERKNNDLTLLWLCLPCGFIIQAGESRTETAESPIMGQVPGKWRGKIRQGTQTCAIWIVQSIIVEHSL